MPILDRGTFEGGGGLGGFEFSAIRPCDDPLLPAFLQALSARILGDPRARQLPDLVTFGYFCRKVSVQRAQAAVSDLDKRLGWGTIVHIAPSNIPINFAFSFVMGFLAGNSNIVRVPTKAYPQMALLVQLFDELAAQPQFSALGRQTAFVQTDRDSPRLEALVTQAQGIVVWGGDATVEKFRRMRKAPRCVEAYFPNRVSSVVLDAQACVDADAAALQALSRSFFNDSYLVDQNACSSPSLVFWCGDAAVCAAARAIFWAAVGKVLDEGYALDPVARIDRMLDVMRFADAAQDAVVLEQARDDLWLLKNPHLRSLSLRFGTFLEASVATPAEIVPLLRPNEQTITTFGVRPEEVFAVLKVANTAVDRIVPVGRALDIGMHWDGRDMLSHLSRKVQVG
jgi:hypothetical protein